MLPNLANIDTTILNGVKHIIHFLPHADLFLDGVNFGHLFSTIGYVVLAGKILDTILENNPQLKSKFQNSNGVKYALIYVGLVGAIILVTL